MKRKLVCQIITLFLSFSLYSQHSELNIESLNLVEKFDVEGSDPALKILSNENTTVVYDANNKISTLFSSDNNRLKFKKLGTKQKIFNPILTKNDDLYNIDKNSLYQINNSGKQLVSKSIHNQFGSKIIGSDNDFVYLSSIDLNGTLFRKINKEGETVSMRRSGGDGFCSSSSIYNHGYRSSDDSSSDGSSFVVAGLDVESANQEQSSALFVSKMDTEFNNIWTTSIPSNSAEIIIGITKTKNNGTLLLTYSNSITCAKIKSSGGRLIKINDDGILEWETCISDISINTDRISSLSIKPIEINSGYLIPLNLYDNSIGAEFFLYDKNGGELRQISIPKEEISDMKLVHDQILFTSGNALYSFNSNVLEKKISLPIIKDNDIEIYPNPGNDVINISSTSYSVVYIYNNLGVKIARIPLHEASVIYNISHLSEGLYFISDEQNETVNKFVKINTH